MVKRVCIEKVCVSEAALRCDALRHSALVMSFDATVERGITRFSMSSIAFSEYRGAGGVVIPARHEGHAFFRRVCASRSASSDPAGAEIDHHDIRHGAQKTCPHGDKLNASARLHHIYIRAGLVKYLHADAAEALARHRLQGILRCLQLLAQLRILVVGHSLDLVISRCIPNFCNLILNPPPLLPRVKAASIAPPLHRTRRVVDAAST